MGLFRRNGSRLMVCECNCQCAGVQSMPKCILKHCFGYAFCHMPHWHQLWTASCWPGQHKSQCQTDKSAYFICILLGWLCARRSELGTRRLESHLPAEMRVGWQKTYSGEKENSGWGKTEGKTVKKLAKKSPEIAKKQKKSSLTVTHTHTRIRNRIARSGGAEKICEMRTFTKIDKWRLARLKCQIRTVLPRLFMQTRQQWQGVGLDDGGVCPLRAADFCQRFLFCWCFDLCVRANVCTRTFCFCFAYFFFLL